ncbi:hypothetical protein C3F09_01935 [candidate division GN15 bacterium]|uniref:Uncharacterized protein n=1 Tax=candidate division GN15 bacterium TaxID=2072418 RepID=A0A855X5G7_9BACT|nr:MAG: hypothetical protein C3F09_01935 [candidate division GN15 bacterium]
MGYRQTLVAASLVLLTISGGCSTVVKTSLEEARKQPNLKLRAVECAVAIRGAELRTGEFIPFNAPTGDYRHETQEILGINSSGDSVIIPVKQTRSVHVRSVNRLAAENTVMPTDKFLLAYSRHASRDSSSRNYPLRTRIEFKGHKGLVDTLRDNVSGLTKDGHPVDLDCKDVFRVEYKRFSLSKTLVSGAVFIGMTVAWAAWLQNSFNHADWTHEDDENSW